jgi:hypothetical protein
MRSFIVILFGRYCVGENRNACKVSVEKCKGNSHYEHLSIDGSIILKRTYSVGGYGLHLCGSERHQWRTLLSTIMNLLVPYNTGNV